MGNICTRRYTHTLQNPSQKIMATKYTEEMSPPSEDHKGPSQDPMAHMTITSVDPTDSSKQPSKRKGRTLGYKNYRHSEMFSLLGLI